MLLLSACGAGTAKDVDFYIGHPEARRDMLESCHRDPGTKSSSADCINAEAALRKLSFSGDSMPTIK
jgi:hypothetical protein